MKNFPFVFFGTPEPAVEILNELFSRGMVPALIITNPDKPQGKKQVLTPSPVKVWADEHAIPTLQPEKIDGHFIEALKTRAPVGGWTLFIVVAYGKILPRAILDIPKHGSINVHYSFLPKYRGASPIESQILADDRDTGVSILLLDEKMDHGPLLASAPVPVPYWPPTSRELRSASNKVAAMLLADILPKYLDGLLEPQEQDHNKATYTKKFTTADGEINLSEDPYKNFLKIRAFSDWLPVYFFVEKSGKKIRVNIKEVEFKDGDLHILRVVPEGKQEMDYKDFAKGYLP